MARTSNQAPWATILAVIVASAAIHIALWPLGERVLEWSWDTPPIAVGGAVLEVSLIPPDEAERDVLDKEQTKPPGKLINIERPEDERPPEDAKYVSEFDNRTDNPTRAPNRRQIYGPSAQFKGDRPDADNEHALENQSRTGKALALGRDALGAAGEGKGANNDLDAADHGQVARDPGLAAKLSPRGIKGNPNAWRRSWGQSGSHDDIDDGDIGDKNIQNTRRWKYSSFFNRVRNTVAEHWHPEVVHRAKDPEGRINGTKTRKTRLIIRLNPDGSLNKIRLDKSSNVGYLDEEAIRAVRAAQPFPNPPSQLVGKNGLIQFGFAFIFEISGGIRINRYRL